MKTTGLRAVCGGYCYFEIRQWGLKTWKLDHACKTEASLHGTASGESENVEYCSSKYNRLLPEPGFPHLLRAAHHTGCEGCVTEFTAGPQTVVASTGAPNGYLKWTGNSCAFERPPFSVNGPLPFTYPKDFRLPSDGVRVSCGGVCYLRLAFQCSNIIGDPTGVNYEDCESIYVPDHVCGTTTPGMVGESSALTGGPERDEQL